MGAPDLPLAMLAGKKAADRIADTPIELVPPGDMESLDDVAAYLALWNAAASLFVEDAVLYVTQGPGPDKSRRQAYRDLREIGPITRRLAAFCLVDPIVLYRAFLAKAGDLLPDAPTPERLGVVREG